jgi:serine/threonine protein kinase
MSIEVDENTIPIFAGENTTHIFANENTTHIFANENTTHIFANENTIPIFAGKDKISFDNYTIDVSCMQKEDRKYFIKEKIGKGMYGNVYNAFNEKGKQLAIKIIPILSENNLPNFKQIKENRYSLLPDMEYVQEENALLEIEISNLMSKNHLGPHVYDAFICDNAILHYNVLKLIDEFPNLLENIKNLKNYLKQLTFKESVNIPSKLNNLTFISDIYIGLSPEFKNKITQLNILIIQLVKILEIYLKFKKDKSSDLVISETPVYLGSLLKDIDKLLIDILDEKEDIVKQQQKYKLDDYAKIKTLLNVNHEEKEIKVKLGMIFMEKLDVTLNQWIISNRNLLSFIRSLEKIRIMFVNKIKAMYNLGVDYNDIHDENVMLKIDGNGKPLDVFIIDYGQTYINSDLPKRPDEYFNHKFNDALEI